MKIHTGFNVRIRMQRRGHLSFATAMFVMALPALMFQTDYLHRAASAEQLKTLQAYREKKQRQDEQKLQAPILLAAGEIDR